MEIKCILDITNRGSLAMAQAILLLGPYLESCGLTVKANQDEAKWTLYVINSNYELMPSWLSLPELLLDFFPCTGMSNQWPEHLLQFKQTCSDQTPINRDTLLPFLTSTPSRNEESGVHIHDRDELDDKENCWQHEINHNNFVGAGSR